jgi:hypothetical protein
MSRSVTMVTLLIQSGADVNKPSMSNLPLISAATSGELEIVKLLIQAGADIHAIQPRAPGSEYVANAYSAADMNGKHEIVEYLKSLGAGVPVLPDWKPLEAGVHMWENFSELVVKGSVADVASTLAKLINGKSQQNVCGKEFTRGKNSFVVLQPKGMAWCNVMRITPQPDYYNPDRELPQKLANTGLPVLLVQYNDTAGAAEIERFVPDSSAVIEDGWDKHTLEEVVRELDDEAPPELKARLAAMRNSEDEESTSELRLTKLAKQERFAIAWGSLRAEPGRKVEIAFTNLPAEAFDGTAWVSD